MDAAARVAAAKQVILEYGWIDGAHHKQWVLDQALRCLCGAADGEATPEYAKLFADDAEDDNWDTGIPP